MRKIVLMLITLMILAYFVSPVLAKRPYYCYSHFSQCSNAGLQWGVCGWITCDTNADCQDGNPLTTNTCINPGTTSSYCNHNNCPSNTADVNNNPIDGCEVNLLTDPNNCGSVGNICESGVCINGVCCNPAQAVVKSVDPISPITLDANEQFTVTTTVEDNCGNEFATGNVHYKIVASTADCEKQTYTEKLTHMGSRVWQTTVTVPPIHGAHKVCIKAEEVK